MEKFYSIQNILFIFTFLALVLPAQAQKECGFDLMMEQARAQNPDFENSRRQVEAFTRNYAATAGERSNNVIRIPTIVHVPHNGEAVGTYPNMSDAQILSGIVNLNQAFQNTAPYAGTAYYNNAMNVEFVLAKVTPEGAASTGIVRHDVSGKPYASAYNNDGISSGSGNGVPQETLFADYLWNPQDYMNIWLVKKINDVDTGTTGNGVLGYATLPLSNPGTTDGLVCQARAFGYYVGYDHNNRPADYDFGPVASHLNGTADHEVGHYLNLQHTFNGDANGTQCPPASGTIGTNDDGCPDIAPHKRTSSVCPAYSATGNDCTNGPNEYIHNFMNYSSDPCFQGFSANQKTRVEAAVNGPRKAFINATGDETPVGSFPAPVAATISSLGAGLGIFDITLNGTTFTSQNSSNDGGYLNRIASQPTVDLAYSTAYTMTVQVGVNNNTPNKELVDVYIDYNGNNAFETTERVYQTAGGAGKINGIFSFSFTTPASVSTPNQRLRMRVISDFDNNQDVIASAIASNAGQIEDYSVRFAAALPVELNLLKATPETKSIALDWQTATEQNNEGFEIQRSTDNRNFTTIDFVKGAGTTDAVQNYSYDDYNVTSGQLYYYRLNQQDFDGATQFSQVVSARINGDESVVNVYPNPANSWLTIETETGEGALEFEIYNTLGAQVLSSTSTDATQRVNVSHLPLGNYYVRVKSNNRTTTVKKVVLGL